MLKKNLDKFLNIRTTGTRELSFPTLIDYNRTESTEYSVLDRLFDEYEVQDHDRLVDFGAGKGRILFYVHHYHDIPVTGIEMHDLSFEDLKQNKVDYFKEHPGNEDEIMIIHGLVEDYKIKPEDTIFYFFNPFSIRIFKKVMTAIQQSLKESPRQADIIFYYPAENIKGYILENTSFKEFLKIETAKHRGVREHIAIFRSQKILTNE